MFDVGSYKIAGGVRRVRRSNRLARKVFRHVTYRNALRDAISAWFAEEEEEERTRRKRLVIEEGRDDGEEAVYLWAEFSAEDSPDTFLRGEVNTVPLEALPGAARLEVEGGYPGAKY